MNLTLDQFVDWMQLFNQQIKKSEYNLKQVATNGLSINDLATATQKSVDVLSNKDDYDLTAALKKVADIFVNFKIFNLAFSGMELRSHDTSEIGELLSMATTKITENSNDDLVNDFWMLLTYELKNNKLTDSLIEQEVARKENDVNVIISGFWFKSLIKVLEK